MRRIQRGRPISIAGSWQRRRSSSGWSAPRRAGQNNHRPFWPSRLFLTTATTGAVLIIAFWAAFWAPWFRITDVRIENASPSTVDSVKELIYGQFRRMSWLILPQDNILIFDVDSAARMISDNFIFDDLKIEKKLPNQLTISVREKTVRAVYWDNERFWALDGTGFVIRETNDREIKTITRLPPEISAMETPADAATTAAAETAAAPLSPPSTKPPAIQTKTPSDRLDGGYPLIIGAADKKTAAPGDVVVPPALLSLILQAHARLPDLAEQSVWFRLMNGKDSVEAVMESGWRVYLTSNTPFDVQASRLAVVLRDKIGDRRSELDYIDLRYDERIFIRFKDGSTK
ncbi:MAG: hypothetical protein WCT10_01685 [Patescibacteria group bacterium]